MIRIIMSIGIIITASFDDEINKRELIRVNKEERPWLQNLDPQHMVHYQGKQWVTDDVSIGYYVKHMLKIPIHFINLESDTAEDDIHKNIVNILIIYDLLEAFHTLPEYKFKKIEYLLKQPNVYPPYEFQHFVNHKNVYYEYLRGKGIPVLPFVYVSQKDFEKNKEDVLDRIMNMEKGDYGKIISKPIYGQDSKGVMVFNSTVKRSRIEAELERMFHVYNGIIFQPYISSFANKNEYKIMFFGDSVAYGVFMKKNDDNYQKIVTEKERPDIFAFARDVFKNLPTMQLQGTTLPRLITRIDVGCCYGENNSFFLSEVEFVPSLFTDVPEINKLLPDALIGKQIESIYNIYKQLHEKNKKDTNKKETTAFYRKYIVLVVCLLLLASLYFILRKNKKLFRKIFK